MKKGRLTKEDWEKFIGCCKGMDVERMKAEIKRERSNKIKR